jgi:hypothetical protein
MRGVGQSYYKAGVERRLRRSCPMLAVQRSRRSEGNGVRCQSSYVPNSFALQERLRSDSMVPMHQDLSFSSLVSEIVPSVRSSGFRTPCCRGRSVRTSLRVPGRIGDVAPDPMDSIFFQPVSDFPEAEPPQTEEEHGDVSYDGNTHSLEIEIVRDALFDESSFPNTVLFL